MPTCGLTPCMPCSFGRLQSPRSGAGGPLGGHLQVIVSDRCVPVMTAAYGTRVARPARTAMIPTWRRLPAWSGGETGPR